MIAIYDKTVSKDYSASPGEGLLADTSNGPFTITLPVNPAVGATVSIVDAGGTFDKNNVTVRGINRIEGLSREPLILDAKDTIVELIYADSRTGWKLNALFDGVKKQEPEYEVGVDFGVDEGSKSSFVIPIRREVRDVVGERLLEL